MTTTSPSLAEMLLRSSQYDSDLGGPIEKAWPPTSQRNAISLAYCRSAFDHAPSQRVPIEAGLTGTALALIRLQFEAVVRGAWPLLVDELRQLNRAVKIMHSFVHGGVHAVVHALRGYPDDSLVAVLQNRNLSQLVMSNIEVLTSSHRPDLMVQMRALRERHARCMPPVGSSA